MKKVHLSPLIIIVLSFLTIIVIGTVLLKLPFSINEGQSVSWVDAFFTSTSAICVTGLSTIPDIGATFSIFGKIVIALLIHIGGLGIVTIAIYILMILGIRIGVMERYVLKEAMNQPSIQGMVKLVKKIILTSFAIEFVGLIMNFIVFIQDYPFWAALGNSAFHTVSSFNNAGFDILGSTSLMAYSDNVLLNISTMLMIILGGIGFIVIFDVAKKRKWRDLTIYTRAVIKISAFLIVFGSLFLKLTNYDSITWLQAIFQSVTTRTAGFSTTNIGSLSVPSLALIMGFMFVGASPNSTGGGIKTTTLYTMFFSTISFLRGKPPIIKQKRIDEETRLKAFTLAGISIMMIFIVFITLSSIETNNPNLTNPFTDLLFETMSAFGTVGLSTGITPVLSTASKWVVMIMMFVGRLGPITIFGIFNKNWGHPNVSNVEYAPAKILIG
ncbi:MAG: H(+)-transporting ATPase [Tenericutes bacterium HGW-Tenericutes-1]|jgi:trk system potassium uptake protein TrkH|nr:MAG: H(+)-transporting ATPase [Tenericutes bacterium HGW-Tenericutes-1]